MRTRRNVAKKWEEENKRTWLYAGKGKGANVAAWTQAVAAERAAALRPSVEYAQALLDLVKAFDRVPLRLLVDEADALGYPLTILRLSIATYKLERVIRIGNVVSKSVWAYRGITAGSGFATTEMRIIMLRVVDRACKLYPMVGPTLFVDDLAADATAPATLVVQQLGGFIETVASFIEDTKQKLSKTKSLLTASTKKIGDLLCCRWKENGILIIFRKKTKALGVGLGAGVRRNVDVAKGRLQGYSARVARFRRLRKIGIDTARLLHTGLKAMTYVAYIMGSLMACSGRRGKSRLPLLPPVRERVGRTWT